MKTLITILLFSTLSTNANARLPGFEELPDSDLEQQIYLEGKRRAIKYVEMAMPNLEVSQKFDAKMVIRRLSSASLYVAANPSSSEHCQKNGNPVYMFVNPNHIRAIFVCDIIRNNIQQDDVDTVAQLLIHEAVHLGKIHDSDECNPTRFELDVISKSIGIQSTITRDGYSTRCGGFPDHEHIQRKTGFKKLDTLISAPQQSQRSKRNQR